MTNLEKRKELAERVINLINEYLTENNMSGYGFISKLEPSEDYEYISFIDQYGENNEYYLTNVAEFLRDDMEGWGASFHENIYLGMDNLEYEYKSKKFKTKEEFINHAGSLYYRLYRTEEIFEGLKAIEEEAVSVMDLPEF